jgi:acyl-CoA-binding protein
VSDLLTKFEGAATAVKKLKEDPGSDVKLQLSPCTSRGAKATSRASGRGSRT